MMIHFRTKFFEISYKHIQKMSESLEIKRQRFFKKFLFFYFHLNICLISFNALKSSRPKRP